MNEIEKKEPKKGGKMPKMGVSLNPMKLLQDKFTGMAIKLIDKLLNNAVDFAKNYELQENETKVILILSEHKGEVWYNLATFNEPEKKVVRFLHNGRLNDLIRDGMGGLENIKLSDMMNMDLENLE